MKNAIHHEPPDDLGEALLESPLGPPPVGTFSVGVGGCKVLCGRGTVAAAGGTEETELSFAATWVSPVVTWATTACTVGTDAFPLT